MSHWSYLAVLGFILLGTLWLEVVVRTRVLRKTRRLVLSVLPVTALFVVWDWYAVSRGHWSFDPSRVTGVDLPGSIPIEEVLFFLVIPLASILTLEAVRSVRRWTIGDENSADTDSVP